MAMYPKEADVILDELTAAAAAARGQGRLAPALMNSEYETLHKHTFYIPALLVAGANTPIVLEFLGYGLCGYKPGIPLNVHFMLHRCTEVFMVLLGESVLQLITSVPPEPPHGTSHEAEVLMEEKFAAMQMMGFILTLTIMHSFILAEPSPDEHVVNRGGAPAALWFILFLVKALRWALRAQMAQLEPCHARHPLRV